MPKANLKIISITSCVALAALNALALFPEAGDFRVYLTGASLAIALGLLMAILFIRSEKAGPENQTETARPVPVPVQTAGNREEAEIVSFLAIFWFGWPKDDQLESLRSEWLKAKDQEERQEIAAKIQQRAFEVVPYIPTGQYEFKTALRKNLKGYIEAPAFFLWNVEKT